MEFAPQILWLPVGGDCNCRCDGCAFVQLPPIHPEQARLMMETMRPGMLVLQGPGEPTLRDDLERLVHAVRRGGAGQVALVTNGRVLAYARRAEALASLRLGLIAVTLRDVTAEGHDRATRVPGSFEQSLAGLRNLARALQGQPTSLIVRAPIQPSLHGKVAALALLSREAGVDEVWFDGDEDPALADEVAGQVRRGMAVRWRGAIESLLLAEPAPARSRDGDVPARFHDDAVSLVVRTGCANACLFCTTRIIQEASRSAWPLTDLSVFHDALDEGRRRELRTLRMVAVEPLEHPDIVDLVRRARDQGYTRVEAWTSARALMDEARVAELVEAGLTHIDVPLFGPDRETHDVVADVPGSFDETLEGLRQAAGRFEVSWHLVLTRQNLDGAAGTLELAERLGLGQPSSVLIPSPSSTDVAPYAAFVPRLADVARMVAGLPPAQASTLLQRGLGHQVPPCVLAAEPALAGLLRDLPPLPPQALQEAGEDEPGAADKLRQPCPLRARCAAAHRCGGIHRMYLELVGSGELTPQPSVDVVDPA